MSVLFSVLFERETVAGSYAIPYKQSQMFFLRNDLLNSSSAGKPRSVQTFGRATVQVQRVLVFVSNIFVAIRMHHSIQGDEREVVP